MRFAALTMAVLAGACVVGPRLHPWVVHRQADPALTVQVEELGERAPAADLAVEGAATASTAISIERISVAPGAGAPCADPAVPAATVLVDGVPSWARPLPLAGTHRLAIEVPNGPELDEIMAGDAAVDLAYRHDGAPACLRVPLVGAGDGPEWTPGARVMAGVRLGGPHLTLGLRVGRWLGPILAAGEGAMGPDRASLAVFGQARLLGSIGLQLGGMGWWELAGAYRPRGSFRYGPRAAFQIWTQSRPRRLGGAQVGFGSLDVAVARWLPAEGEGPATELMVEIGVWWNASSRGLRF